MNLIRCLGCEAIHDATLLAAPPVAGVPAVERDELKPRNRVRLAISNSANVAGVALLAANCAPRPIYHDASAVIPMTPAHSHR
jgi:hypothetical protein